MRYQLLKTSPYLGGQVRLDIPLYYHYDPSDASGHVIDTPELYLAPLNDNIRFNEDNDWDCFRYSHLENIKHLYNKIGDDFYSAEGELNGHHKIYNGGYLIDPYSHFYNMGPHRLRYSRYNKQFSYLCPLWISEETEAENLCFELSICIPGEERDHIVRRIFKLGKKLCNYIDEYTHKSARYTEPDPSNPNDGAGVRGYLGVGDDLLSIKFNPDEAYITGVQVDAARYTTKDVSYIIPGITHREVPMMEFDNMLLYNFKENHIIAQQLINLNFLFNLDDISFYLMASGLETDENGNAIQEGLGLVGNMVNFNIRAKYRIDENSSYEYLDLKDLYTNYSHIPVYRLDMNNFDDNHNVLDYLHDDKIVDYSYRNKFTQPIFHWAMVENPGFIYNFYDGFSPTFIDNGELCMISGRYYDQAMVGEQQTTPYNFANHWCHFIDGTGIDISGLEHQMAVEVAKYESNFSRLIVNKDTMIAYLNNNRYDISNIQSVSNIYPDYPSQQTIDISEILDNLQGKTIYISNIKHIEITDPDDPTRQYDYSVKVLSKNSQDYENIIPDNTYLIYIGCKESEINNMTLVNLLANLYKVRQSTTSMVWTEISPIDDDVWSIVGSLLGVLANCWIPPYRIDFSRTTRTLPVEPVGNMQPEELNMYKDNHHNNHVLRYTGSLCPMFIAPVDDQNSTNVFYNIAYGYDQWSDINDPSIATYKALLKTNMDPMYPSIGYYGCMTPAQYDDFAGHKDTMRKPLWYDQVGWIGEVFWKMDNIIYALSTTYSGTHGPVAPIIYNEQAEEIFWTKLYDHIAPQLNIKVGDDGQGNDIYLHDLDPDDARVIWFKHWLKTVYNIQYRFEYASPTNISEIVYTYTFTLM